MLSIFLMEKKITWKCYYIREYVFMKKFSFCQLIQNMREKSFFLYFLMLSGVNCCSHKCEA